MGQVGSCEAVRVGAIILTKNEEQHITRCLQSLAGKVDVIYVVDSFSDDRTVAIATALGAETTKRHWLNYSDQFSFAMASFPSAVEWLLRIDADEVLELPPNVDLRMWLSRQSADVSGVEVIRKLYFCGQWMKHGGMYPLWMLRLWRPGRASIEARWMDEHMCVSWGKVVRFSGAIHDDNRKGLAFWVEKHVGYAKREVLDLEGWDELDGGDKLAGQAGAKRKLKNWYSKCPLIWRALFYWFFRYFVLSGFLDGRRGFVFHLFHALWYRTLVDMFMIERENARSATVPKVLE